MSTISLTLDEIFDLAKKTLLANGCNDETASILSDLIRNAERDGSLSHGLFRLPAYVSGLKSGKINGKGKPEVKKISASVIKVQGNNCLAPVVLNKGLQKITLFNPVVYLVSGFRWSFFGNADVPILVSLLAISSFTIVCILIVAWIFKTGWRIKQ